MLLRIWPAKTDKCLLRLERGLTCLDVGGKEFLQLVELTPLLFDAGLRCVGLLASGLAGRAGGDRAADELRSADD